MMLEPRETEAKPTPWPAQTGCRPGVWRNLGRAFCLSLRGFAVAAKASRRFWGCAAALLAGVASLEADSGGASQLPSRQMLKVIPRHEDNVIRFFVENREAADVTATFDLALANLKGSTNFPFTRTFAPHQTSQAFELAPIRADREWRYTLTNYYTLGSSQAVHDDRFVYRLPYGPERPFPVSQGFNGGFSHRGPERYAIDWSMPEGTPVLAARAGRVVAIKDDSESGGADQRFEGCANYILIQHHDGTIGNYAHLRARGVRVKPDQDVAAGETIGLSGNTGFSSGPHLHFSVFKTRNGKERESLPIRFDIEQGRGATLVEGRSYPAAPIALHTPNGSGLN